MRTVEDIIRILKLEPHPEGGFYKQTYRSSGTISQEGLEGKYSGSRNFSTCIYFLLTSGNFSAFHRIHQDEIWHFYEGSTIRLHTISPEGNHKCHLVGRNILAGERPQLIVPGEHWFAAEITEGDAYALVGCTVAPGFDFEDFTLAKRDQLLAAYPAHVEVILRLTRE